MGVSVFSFEGGPWLVLPLDPYFCKICYFKKFTQNHVDKLVYNLPLLRMVLRMKRAFQQRQTQTLSWGNERFCPIHSVFSMSTARAWLHTVFFLALHNTIIWYNCGMNMLLYQHFQTKLFCFLYNWNDILTILASHISIFKAQISYLL